MLCVCVFGTVFPPQKNDYTDGILVCDPVNQYQDAFVDMKALTVWKLLWIRKSALCHKLRCECIKCYGDMPVSVGLRDLHPQLFPHSSTPVRGR